MATSDTPLHFLTIHQAGELMRKGELSPVELTRACLDRIADTDDRLHSFILLLEEDALEQARVAESEILRGEYRGHMHGIPFALKDLYDTAGVRTTSGSQVDIDRVPTEDATTTARLKAAGGILLGKLAMHEFALGGPDWTTPFEPACNPWNLDHITGGSSSGSGSSVASGQALGALGSCTGGSIRGPASLCGIVGLKPTYGRVSRAGVVTLSWSQDHAGPMTWTVEDTAYMLQAIAGHDPKDPTSSTAPVPDYSLSLREGIRGVRLGLPRHYFFDPDPSVNPEVVATVEKSHRRTGEPGRHRGGSLATNPGPRPCGELGDHGQRGVRVPRTQPQSPAAGLRGDCKRAVPHRRADVCIRLSTGPARADAGKAGIRAGDADGGLPGNADHDPACAGLRGI